MTSQAHPRSPMTSTWENVFQEQKQFTRHLRVESLAERKNRLEKLRKWIHDNRSRIHQAMYDDFRKAALEVDAIEIFHVLNEIKQALSHLEDWARPQKVDAPLTMLGTRSFIQYEPKGVCLIISPWNYPFCLAIGPLVSAIAAGNNVIIKPSELTPNVSALIKSMASALFSEREVFVVEGDAEVSKRLLELPFDHIFFTGSTAVGKEVMKAAAANLASVTLELGGKSPCIVAEDANLKEAAERIAVAKLVNNGQTCVAPDYIFVHKSRHDEFAKALQQAMIKRFSLDGNYEQSPSYCRVINDRHFLRLERLVDDAVEQGATIFYGGKNDATQRFFHPVILSNVANQARILQEEIFGPIVPLIPYTSTDEVVDFINARPKPLALYLFSRSGKVQKRILAETSAGGVCINDCGIHFLNHELPFGGVNYSGMGKSHGKYGFVAFSNEKPVLQQRSGITSVKVFYPPYTQTSRRLINWFFKFF